MFFKQRTYSGTEYQVPHFCHRNPLTYFEDISFTFCIAKLQYYSRRGRMEVDAVGGFGG